METILELSKFNHVKYYDGPHKYFIGDRELMSPPDLLECLNLNLRHKE